MEKEEGTVSDNPIKNEDLWMFDSLCILDEPVMWVDNDHNVREAYGLLYNREINHQLDDFGFNLKYLVAYIMGASRNLLHNGDVDPEHHIWTLPSGNKLNMEQPNMKELLVRLFQDKFSFRLVELKSFIPYTPENRECVEGYLIVKPELIERLLPDEKPHTKKQIEQYDEEGI